MWMKHLHSNDSVEVVEKQENRANRSHGRKQNKHRGEHVAVAFPILEKSRMELKFKLRELMKPQVDALNNET